MRACYLNSGGLHPIVGLYTAPNVDGETASAGCFASVWQLLSNYLFLLHCLLNAGDFDDAAAEQMMESKMRESPARCGRLGRSEEILCRICRKLRNFGSRANRIDYYFSRISAVVFSQ